MKFNEEGELLWSTMIGDVNTSGWDRVAIGCVVPASDGDFMTVPVRNMAFDICRVDAAFNGYCYNTPFDPVVTDVAPTVVQYTLTPTTIDFTEGSVAVVATDQPHLRTNLCALNGIPEMHEELALTIAPNPASDHFQLFVRTDRPQRVDVSLTNALGSICSTRRYEALPDQPLLIDTSDLAAGAYGVEVRIGSIQQRAMLVVQH